MPDRTMSPALEKLLKNAEDAAKAALVAHGDPLLTVQVLQGTTPQTAPVWSLYQQAIGAAKGGNHHACRGALVAWYRAIQALLETARVAEATGLTPDGFQVAYPICCGQKTLLTALSGWWCATCHQSYQFALAPEPVPLLGDSP